MSDPLKLISPEYPKLKREAEDRLQRILKLHKQIKRLENKLERLLDIAS